MKHLSRSYWRFTNACNYSRFTLTESSELIREVAGDGGKLLAKPESIEPPEPLSTNEVINPTVFFFQI